MEQQRNSHQGQTAKFEIRNSKFEIRNAAPWQCEPFLSRNPDRRFSWLASEVRIEAEPEQRWK
jgi:hypothetical protein